MTSRISRKGGVEKINKKRFQYSPSKVTSALKAIADGMQVATASKLYHVPRTTLRNKVSHISPAESTGHCGPHSVLGKDIEDKLVQWIIDCANMGFPVNKEDLCSSVKKLLDEGNVQQNLFHDNHPGKKWYYSFLKRHPVISQKHAEYVNRARGAVTENKIRAWFQEVKASLKDDVNVLKDPGRVFNMDETCFFLVPKGDLILGPRGRQVYDESSNSDKENITTLFSANANGKFAPPLTVYKYTRIPANIIKSAPPEWGIGKTETGWMTGESFFEYITNVFLPFLIKSDIPRPVIVFLDGHRSHLTIHLSKFCRENQIILVALYPNSTHILQPLDVAVFGPMKQYWKKIVRKWRIDNDNKEITKAEVPLVLSKLIYEPNMEQNVKAGFGSTGLYPFDADKVDYTRCIVRKLTTSQQEKHVEKEEIMKHLQYIESKIGGDLLQQFRQTKKRNHNWEGDPHATLLFDVWEKIFEENLLTPSSTEPVHEILNDVIEQESELDSVVFNDTNENDHDYSKSLPAAQMEVHALVVQNIPAAVDLSLGLDLDLSSTSISLENILSPSRSLSDLMDSPGLCSLPINSNIISTSAIPSSLFTDIDRLSTSDTPQSSDTTLKISSKPTTIQITPPKTLATVFNDVIRWPDTKVPKGKKKREITPAVVTSDKWLEFHMLKEEDKKEKERQKNERKLKRELNRKQKEVCKTTKVARGTTKKQAQKPAPRSSKSNPSSSDEEWIESGDSLDDVELGLGELDDPEDVEFSGTENLKVGDFVLTKFCLAGKKSLRVTEYKYVGVIVNIISDCEFDIQCLKCVDSRKTQFVIIENDISQINILNIIGKLPDPILKEEGRMLVNVFPGAVKTVEKH